MGFLCASTSKYRSNSPPTKPRGESSVIVTEDVIHVSVGKDVKESKMTLAWALRNSGGRKICILHVQQLAKTIPMMGTEFPLSYADPKEVRAYHENERQNMHLLLDIYSQICEQAGVRAEKLHIEMDSIEEGIVKLLSQHGITKLVMGAAADKLYSKKMVEPISKKARYVCLHAPVSCHIWFICKGNLIYTRERRFDAIDLEAASQSLQSIPNAGCGLCSSLRSRHVTEGRNNQLTFTSSAADIDRASSDNRWMQISSFPSADGIGGVTPRSRLHAEVSFDELARASESLYVAELKRTEEALTRAKEELRVALEQNSCLESQLPNSAVSRLRVPQLFLLILVILVVFLIFVFSGGLDLASSQRSYSIV